MSSDFLQTPRPFLWKMDTIPTLEKRATVPVVVPSHWPDEMTHEQTNPLLAKWSLNANLVGNGPAMRESIELLDMPAARDEARNENPLVLVSTQATLVLERSLLQFDAEWDKLMTHTPAPRSVLLSIHTFTPHMIIALDDAVCAYLLHTLHSSEHRLLASWEESERASRDLTDGVMCTSVTPAVGLALLMALQSEEAFAKVMMLSPAGVMEDMLSMMHGDAMLALDWLAGMMEQLLVAGLRPDGPRYRDEVALVDNATAIMSHWLMRTHQGELNPLPENSGTHLPHNSMVAGATAAVFIAAAARFFVRAKEEKLRGNLQRTVHDAWLVYKQVVNLGWLPPPLEQRILSSIAHDTPEGYRQLREHARSLKVPRLNAALFADWLGLVLAWLGVYAPESNRPKGDS